MTSKASHTMLSVLDICLKSLVCDTEMGVYIPLENT